MTIRPMLVSDAKAVSNLSGQLGYPMEASQTEERMLLILAQPDQALFVVDCDGEVAGWIHLTISHPLVAATSNVEIAGLVIDERFRGQGFGKALVKKAEAWTLEQGLFDLKLRSAMKRTEAHRFYQDLGFSISKTQARFEKNLS